jgi:2,3-bisphosphoglycerate-independent phosphoglycerate mutase
LKLKNKATPTPSDSEMKFAIIIPDGAADEPQEELNGQTPLEAACTPHMDQIAAQGVVARACHTPPDLPAGSEIGNLSLLGYDPHANFTGRAPMEAAAQGITLGPNDWAIRCNLVTITDQIMKDFTADHITTAESTDLLNSAQSKIASREKFGGVLEFVPGVSYRNLLIWRGNKHAAPFAAETVTTAPHDITDQAVLDFHPLGPGSDLLSELMDYSVDLFADHPVNVVRQGHGKLPATNIWLWGQGLAPKLRPFSEEYGPCGAMITAVDLLRGIASLIGWERIEVDGATGYLDTNYAAKGRAGVDALNRFEIVCIHVEASDEASHEGRCDEKVKALEQIDAHIVGPMLDELLTHDQWRIMVSPDHPTFLRTKAHHHGNVPVAMAGTGIDSDTFMRYGDSNANESCLVFDEGWKMMKWFID